MRHSLHIDYSGNCDFNGWWLPIQICMFDSKVKPGIEYTAKIKAVKRFAHRELGLAESEYQWVTDGHKGGEDSLNVVTEIIFTDIREE